MLMTCENSLASLERLSALRLDETARRIRSDLADAEWKMSVCLLAMVRTGGFRKLGFATISEYGERVLNLSGKKLAWLLGAARALEHLPKLSEAFKKGEISWGKVRALQSLATPETEEQWLEFALKNTTEAVAKKVALSPRGWKRHRALESSLRKAPVASAKAVRAVLHERIEACGSSSELESNCAAKSTGEVEPSSVTTPLQHQPEKIRMVVEFTPDQYALYEAAERRVRGQVGKRISRGEVIAKMSEGALDKGTARSRARHQVLIHSCEGCERAWYETAQGVKPVSPEVLKEAMEQSKPVRVESVGSVSGTSQDCGKNVCVDRRPESPSVTSAFYSRKSDKGGESRPNSPGGIRTQHLAAGREHIPNSTIRQLFARAGNCCERCGSRGVRLDIHHTTPVSEGGASALKDLRLYCRACHTLHHERDLEEKPAWRRAKKAAMRRASG